MPWLNKGALLGIALLLAATGADAKTRITIPELNWTGGKAVGYVLKSVIEDRLGYEVEIIRGMGEQALIAEGMSKGDGSVDVFPDLWMPNQQVIWNKYVGGSKTIKVNDHPYPGYEGIFVPKYIAEKVKTIDDMKKPEIAALFDKDGDGKGEYFAGDPSWKTSKIWPIKFKSYGLDELWEPEHISDATFKGELQTAYVTRKPILFYYWSPEWIHVAYNLSRIKEPPYVPGCKELHLDQPDWLEASKFGCESPPIASYVGYSKSLNERAPDVARFLQHVSFDPAVVSEWIFEIGRDHKDPADVAEAWVKNNASTVDAWLKK